MYKNGSPTVQVKSAARVLDVFELLLSEPKGLSLSEISERLRFPASSAHALIRTLMNRGYAVRGDDLLIRLGPRLCQYARAFADGLELTGIADPTMAEVSRLCGQTVSLAVLEDREVVFVHKRVAAGTVHVANPVGARLPAHATGLGKSMLALLSPEELQQLYPVEQLKAATVNTIVSRAELFATLDDVRRTGVAYDREESNLGVFAVGSAIRDHRGNPLASISIVLPAAQVDPKLERRWAALIKVAGQVVSYRLGYIMTASDGVPAEGALALAWQRGEHAVERV